MARPKNITKIVDPKPEVSVDSRLDKYWKQRGILNMFLKFRPGFIIPRDLPISTPAPVTRKFKLKGLEFGNWVGVEDRKNYLAALTIALLDLNTILDFKNNIGLNGTVGIAFGARGSSRALAHFEPLSFMINLTRHKSLTRLNKIRESLGQPRLSSSDEVTRFLFEKTGGVGSLAHEYGHALDFFFGTFIDQDRNNRAITLGFSTATRFNIDYPENSFRYLALKVVDAIIWEKPGKLTEYYKKLKEDFGDNEYWFRHAELFARAFEVYISHKLKEAGIINKFLTHSKYDISAYLTGKDFARVLPHMDKLINKIRKEVNK